MDIIYLGAGSVKLSGRRIDVVNDLPMDVKAKADVVVLSTKSDGAENKMVVPSGAMVIDGPGEYEVKGAMITGVPARAHGEDSGHNATVYSVLVDGVNVVMIGNVSGKLDEVQIENLGQVDVLVVPVGGGVITLDAEGAAQLVTQLEPSYVVPVHYDDGVTNYASPQAKVDLFLKEMGSAPEAENRLRINQKEQPAETQVVLLSRAGA